MSLKRKANLTGDAAIVTAILAIIIAIVSLWVNDDYSGIIVINLMVISFKLIDEYTKIRQKEIDEIVDKEHKEKIENGKRERK